MKASIIAVAACAVLGGCANTYSTERTGVPYHVQRGYHLECVRAAKAHGNFNGKTDRNATEQAGALAIAGVVGLVAYEIAEPKAKNNPYYRQCMADAGIMPKG